MTRKVAAAPHSRPSQERAATLEVSASSQTPTLTQQPLEQQVAERSSTTSAIDVVDPARRHRMISEVAFRMYAQRDYAEGYAVDDWLAAEAEVDLAEGSNLEDGPGVP